MIIVAFFVPLAIYLLVLGHINRQPRPLFVSGTFDFAGLLFAVSGFLLCGGPAVLFSLNERWRMFWLLGEGGLSGLAAAQRFSLLLTVFYFATVVVGCVMVLSRQRALTAIYNVEPAVVESTLEEICERFGLDPVRSDNLFVFGVSLAGARQATHPEGIQGPHALPRTDRPVSAGLTIGEEYAGQNAVLEVESFDRTKHVTLHWDPANSRLRPLLEAELERQLAMLDAPTHETALWLNLAGFALLALSVVIVFGLILRAMWVH